MDHGHEENGKAMTGITMIHHQTLHPYEVSLTKNAKKDFFDTIKSNKHLIKKNMEIGDGSVEGNQ